MTVKADLYLGDCLEILSTLEDNSIDAVITDPPYGMGKFNGDNPELADSVVGYAMEESRRISKGNILSFWSAQRFEVINDIFAPKHLLIWNKTWAIHAPNNMGNRYEFIVWVRGGNANQRRGDIYECFPIIRKIQGENVNHPTQKPIKLLIKLLLDFTKEGDTVLDPFMGSGTTGIACMLTGRNFIGIEINEKYYKIAETRIRRAEKNAQIEEDWLHK